MVGIIYVYVVTVFRFLWVLKSVCVRACVCVWEPFYCLVGCLSRIVWTPAVLGALYVLHSCICTCLAQLSMCHMERRSRITLIAIIIIIILL